VCINASCYSKKDRLIMYSYKDGMFFGTSIYNPTQEDMFADDWCLFSERND
jgi:hypothetical protein